MGSRASWLGWSRARRSRRRPGRTSGGDGWSARAAPARRNAPARCSPCGARSHSPGARAPSRLISRSRVTLATIEAAAIESTRASPPITASQSQPHLDAVAPVDEDEPGPHRQRRDRPRQRPQRSLQDVVAVDPRGRAEGDRHLGDGADPGVELLPLGGQELLGIVEAARDALRIEDDGGGDHRSRPAGRARPRRSRRPEAEPRRIAARSRRKVGRMTSSSNGRRAASAVRLMAACCVGAGADAMGLVEGCGLRQLHPTWAISGKPWCVAEGRSS